MSRSLVLTANYSGHDLELPESFLSSLRCSKTDADVVLIANHGSESDQARLRELLPRGRIWVPIPKQRYRVFRRLANTFRPMARVVARGLRSAWRNHPEKRLVIEHRAAYLLNITCSRYLLARQFMQQSLGHYEYVMLADSRDVIFQSDPFEGLPIGLNTGVESVLVKDQPGNIGWLKLLYGDDPGFPMERVLNQNVICSGVTLGDVNSVTAYLEKLCAEFMEKLPRMIHTPYLDQGGHIGLIRRGQIENARLTTNGEEYIATVGTSDLSEFTFDGEGRLLAKDGCPVRIVHQYDRHPFLAQKLLARIAKQSDN